MTRSRSTEAIASAGEGLPRAERVKWAVQLMYDGACPLCTKEATWMRFLDRKKRIDFVDIAAKDFDASIYGSDMATLMDKLHARLPDGRFVIGADAFRKLYETLGFSWLVMLTRLPGMRWLVDKGYEVFAKNRLRLTGRCAPDGACQI